MRLIHRFRVPARVDEVYGAFSRLEQVAPCFPGATVQEADADRFTGAVAVKLGPVPLVFVGGGSYLERSPERHRVVFEVRGEDRRGLGSAVAQVSTRLSARGRHTDVEVVTELELTGKPARFGAGVVSEAGDRLLDQFTSCLAARFTDGSDDPSGTLDADPVQPDPDSPDTPPTPAAHPLGPVFTPEPASTAFVPAPPRARVARLTTSLQGRMPAVPRGTGPVLAGVAGVALLVAVRVLRRGPGPQPMTRSRTVSGRLVSLSSSASLNAQPMSVTT